MSGCNEKHCLLSPISAPSVYGVSFLKMIELVGLFPWNTWVKQGEIFHSTDHFAHAVITNALNKVWIAMFTRGHRGALPPVLSQSKVGCWHFLISSVILFVRVTWDYCLFSSSGLSLPSLLWELRRAGCSFSIVSHCFLVSTYFVWKDFLQSLSAQAAGLQLLPGLLCRLTLHQSFCLGQEVGQQDLQPHQTHTHLQIQHSVCFSLSDIDVRLASL